MRYGHSGRLRRLLVVELSASVLRYLFPALLVATTTHAVLPFTDTWKRQPSRSICSIAEARVSFQRLLSEFMPPTCVMDSLGSVLGILLIQLICAVLATAISLEMEGR